MGRLSVRHCHAKSLTGIWQWRQCFFGSKSAAKHSHDSAGSGSSKNGNGASSVVQNLTGEALLEAARRQLGLPPKG